MLNRADKTQLMHLKHRALYSREHSSPITTWTPEQALWLISLVTELNQEVVSLTEELIRSNEALLQSRKHYKRD